MMCKKGDRLEWEGNGGLGFALLKPSLAFQPDCLWFHYSLSWRDGAACGSLQRSSGTQGKGWLQAESFPVFRKWRFSTLELRAGGMICFARSDGSWDAVYLAVHRGCRGQGAGGLWGGSHAGGQALVPRLLALSTSVLPRRTSVSRWMDHVQMFAFWLLTLQEQTSFLMAN